MLLSGSVANPQTVAEWLRHLGRTVTLIQEHTRPIPLEEVALDAMESREPGGIKGHAARAAVRAVLADLGPVLVFAPRRRAAEQIAREIAHALPLGNGPQLTPAQRAIAGDDLNRLLRQGVGLHHSGLTYEQRSELVEPWAKAGRLNVVVATTGLAAGINFSLRSVLVTDRRYAADHAEREVRPDELLQMFGRAGRRGLDERGYALWTGYSPRLGEARPLQLQRSGGLDWPAFLCVMKSAPEPLAAAERLAQALFTKEPIDLALDRLDEPEPPTPPPAPGSLRLIHEIRGRNGTWQRERPHKNVPLTQALIRVKGTWYPALSKPDSLRAIPVGTPCKLELPEGGIRYGRSVPLARFPKADARDQLEPAEWLRKALRPLTPGQNRPRTWRLESLEKEILPLLPRLTQGGVPYGPLFIAQDTVQVKLDYSRAEVKAIPDADDQWLINPETRTTEVADINLREVLGGGTLHASRPGRLWRKLGLIDHQGRPTERGEIASLFQHGEGLAVAAALEDPTYDAEALAWDLAELRAGERVSASARSSSRLGACCRLTSFADGPGLPARRASRRFRGRMRRDDAGLRLARQTARRRPGRARARRRRLGARGAGMAQHAAVDRAWARPPDRALASVTSGGDQGPGLAGRPPAGQTLKAYLPAIALAAALAISAAPSLLGWTRSGSISGCVASAACMSITSQPSSLAKASMRGISFCTLASLMP